MKRTFITQLTQQRARGAPSATRLLGASLLLLALAAPQQVFASLVTPESVAGNPTCVSLGYGFGYKPQPEPPPSGSYTFPDGVNTVSITSNDTYFDWISTLPIDAVIVKGGHVGANIYKYDPPTEEDEDTGLHPPTNPSGDYALISHIEFCYDYELDVSKTANTTFTRTYEWSIDKTANPAELNAFIGGSASTEWTVSVDKIGYTDSNWKVAGDIIIKNNTPFAATITEVTDILDAVGPLTVNCGVELPTTLPSGKPLTCSYTSSLLDGSDTVNTATVVTSGQVKGGVATAEVTFGLPTTEVYGSINVKDTNGLDEEVSDDASWTFGETFDCSTTPGDYIDGKWTYTKDNSATITDTGASKDPTADASVTLNCYAPMVEKDASTSLTRTYTWTIEKYVDNSADDSNDPVLYDVPSGGEATAHYKVVVTRSDKDSDWAVKGPITVKNPNPDSPMTVRMEEELLGSLTLTHDCGESLTIPAATDSGPGSVTCHYGATLPDATTRTNTVTATINKLPFTGTASVDFSNPTVNESGFKAVDITDNLQGDLGSAGAAGATFSYDHTEPCSDEPGEFQEKIERTNTAMIKQTGQEDSRKVTWKCQAPPAAVLTVRKDAATEWTRDWDWTIAKEGDKLPLTLSLGEPYMASYKVTLGATEEDSGFLVKGKIIIDNLDPEPATLTGVSDKLSNGMAPAVDCTVPFNYELPGYGQLTCTYSKELMDKTALTNLATVTAFNEVTKLPEDFPSNVANVTFSDTPTTKTDECIDLSDSLAGELGTVCVKDTPKEVTYSWKIGPYEVCGPDTVENTVSLESDDEDTKTAKWTIYVDVPCLNGCTLTPGYWKTHSAHGPADYDKTWAALCVTPDGGTEICGADAPFYQSGQTYYQVLWTPPQGGNAYYILAHAYIAAKLNQLDGAYIPTDVLDTFKQATTLFETYKPDFAGLKGKQAQTVRAQFIALAGILDGYNNGLTGPGHCSEDATSAPAGQ